MAYEATVTGQALPLPDNMKIEWVAASPPDKRTSFSGSGIQIASEEQAFGGAAQRGVADVSVTGHFSVTVKAPNSYHVRSSEAPLPPRMFVFWEAECASHKMAIPIPDASVPGRSLRDPVNDLDVSYPDLQTHESYLRASAYCL
jgi:hypothetical protein